VHGRARAGFLFYSSLTAGGLSEPSFNAVCACIEARRLVGAGLAVYSSPLENLKLLRIGRVHVFSDNTPAPPTACDAVGTGWTIPDGGRDPGTCWCRRGAGSSQGPLTAPWLAGERCFALFVDGALATTIWYAPELAGAVRSATDGKAWSSICASAVYAP
jgi:hypothetical protein